MSRQFVIGVCVVCIVGDAVACIAGIAAMAIMYGLVFTVVATAFLPVGFIAGAVASISLGWYWVPITAAVCTILPIVVVGLFDWDAGE